jgi:hypothetical protein
VSAFGMLKVVTIVIYSFAGISILFGVVVFVYGRIHTGYLDNLIRNTNEYSV